MVPPRAFATPSRIRIALRLVSALGTLSETETTDLIAYLEKPVRSSEWPGLESPGATNPYSTVI